MKKLKLSDFTNVDFNNIGAAPDPAKITMCVALFAALLFAGWYFSISDKQVSLESVQKKEEPLKRDFIDKQQRVANLGKLKQQLDDMREILNQLLRQLPGKTQMPDLLVDISQAALSAGLETQLFQPGPEQVKQGFYAEKPIQLRMVGDYHQFGAFISGVAALPSVVILTMHDVSLKLNDAAKNAKAGATVGELVLDGTVKTYRYVEENENDAKKPGAPAAKPAAGKGGA